MTRDNWPEVTEAELQDWLDSHSPDYRLEHEWGDDNMACIDRQRGGVFAFQRKDKRCFVHPDFVRQVRVE